MGFKLKNPPYKEQVGPVTDVTKFNLNEDDTGGPYNMHPSDWKSPERIKKENEENNKKKKK
jgi:hypothetical protein